VARGDGRTRRGGIPSRCDPDLPPPHLTRPASWNPQVATRRSFAAFAQRHGWLDTDATTTIERRRVLEDHSRALSRDDLDRLFTRRNSSVRDRCLWRLLYESAVRAQ